MFLLLSRVLVLLLLGTIVFSLFQRFYPAGSFAVRFLLILLLVIVVVSFFNPAQEPVASLWQVVSFPLKPLGAAILLLFFGAQKIKGGGIDKPAGYYLGWALAILILASTPVVAYFFGISPNQLLAEEPAETLVASVDIKAPSYLLQSPPETRTTELRVQFFVPNATTLQRTTAEWERYIAEISNFLRGRRA